MVKLSKAQTKRPVKGSALSCETCGMAMVVDEVCGCVEVHEIICCGVPMKPKRGYDPVLRFAALAQD